MIRLSFLIFTIALSLSCTQENVDESEIIDLNNDGVQDIFYEYDENGYYELIDRNFDKKIDVSTRYNLKHYAISSKSDDDFDGFLETEWVFKNSFVASSYVDSNYNKYQDIYFKYKDDLVMYAEKFYHESDTLPSRVGRINYMFGYPLGVEVFSDEGITEKHFHEKIAKYKTIK